MNWLYLLYVKKKVGWNDIICTNDQKRKRYVSVCVCLCRNSYVNIQFLCSFVYVFIFCVLSVCSFWPLCMCMRSCILCVFLCLSGISSIIVALYCMPCHLRVCIGCVFVCVRLYPPGHICISRLPDCVYIMYMHVCTCIRCVHSVQLP